MFILAAAVFAAAAFLLFLWKGAFLNEGIAWEEKCFSFSGMELRLTDRQAILYRNNTKVWNSDWDWSVQNAVHSDIDHDGAEELLLLVWKRGSYGRHKPFWVKKNDRNLKQHIFIYRGEENRHSGIRAIWMSSELARIQNIATDSDGNVLVTEADGTVSMWAWENFGLKLKKETVDTVKFYACGDQLLHKSLLVRGLPEDNYDYFYKDLKKYMETADLVSLNAETVLVSDKALVSDYPRFASPEAVADAVKDLGVDVVSTANNHALDQGMYGVAETIEAYRKRGILTVGTYGAGEDTDIVPSVRYLSVNDMKIAFLAFTYGTNGRIAEGHAVDLLSDEERMVSLLDEARAKADAVIVFAHWGTEYSEETDTEQEKYAKLFLQHGVDVVIGTHPHVVQKYELLSSDEKDGKKTLVYYSLGNLISAQKEENCRIGGIAGLTLVKIKDGKVTISDEGLHEVRTVQGSVQWVK